MGISCTSWVAQAACQSIVGCEPCCHCSYACARNFTHTKSCTYTHAHAHVCIHAHAPMNHLQETHALAQSFPPYSVVCVFIRLHLPEHRLPFVWRTARRGPHLQEHLRSRRLGTQGRYATRWMVQNPRDPRQGVCFIVNMCMSSGTTLKLVTAV